MRIGVFGLPELIIYLIVILIVLAIYFLPAIIAMKRDKSNKNAILLLNLFLGWTFIGWVVALAWATMDNDKQE